MQLGVNLAVEPFSLALTDEGKFLIETRIKGNYDFSENLLFYLEQAVTAVGKTIQDINAIGVVSGPGSYTGLRLSHTHCKTLASILNCPLYGMDTFDAYLRSAPLVKTSMLLVIPARKKEFHIRLGSNYPKNLWVMESYLCLKEDRLCEFLNDVQGDLFVTGRCESVQNVPEQHVVSPCDLSSVVLAKFAGECLAEGRDGNYLKVNPKYSHNPV